MNFRHSNIYYQSACLKNVCVCIQAFFIPVMNEPVAGILRKVQENSFDIREMKV